MPLPRIAIVGRPNVGKSSLLNMLARDKVSIVDAAPGVTRDRIAAVVELESPEDAPAKLAEVIDTGGWGVYTADGARYNEVGHDLSTLAEPIETQIDHALRTADLILFVIDVQAGVTALDEAFADALRRQSAKHQAPIFLLANKTDSEKWEPHAAEAASLGFGEPMMISAKTNYFRRDLRERLHEALPEGSEPRDAEAEMKLAIVGKRNTGKSTFVNALAGEDRVIVSEIPGATRDAVDVRFEIDGRTCVAIDTAGLRRKRSIPDQIEWHARGRALRSLDRADVAMLMIDATTPVSQVDKNLSMEIQNRRKPCVIVVAKWDLVQGRAGPKGRPVAPEDYREYLDKELKGLARSPIVFTSSATRLGLAEAVNLAFDLHEQARTRVPTGELNATLREILEQRGPSSKLGHHAKVFYATQVASAPPTIVLIVNKPDLFTPEYQRYLLNRLAERTPFEEVPIRLIIRERRRGDERMDEETESPTSTGRP